MSFAAAPGFRRMRALGGAPARTRARLEAAVAALQTLAQAAPSGRLLDGPSVRGLLADIEIARVLGHALERPVATSVPSVLPAGGTPRGARPAVEVPVAPGRSSQQPRRSARAAARQGRAPVPATPARVAAALAAYAQSGAPATASRARPAAGRGLPTPQALPLFSHAEPARARRARLLAVHGTNGRIHPQHVAAAWSARTAAHVRVVATPESAPQVRALLATALPADAERTITRQRLDARVRPSAPAHVANEPPNAAPAALRGGSLLERVLQRVDTARVPEAVTDRAGVAAERRSSGLPGGGTASERPSPGGFRGLAERTLQEPHRTTTTPPLAAGTQLPREAVFDRMDAVIAASLSRILLHEAERSGIDLAGSAP